MKTICKASDDERHDPSWYANRRRSRRLLLAALVAGVLAALVLPLDLVLSSGCAQDQLPGELRRLLNFSEAFAHGLGVAVILLVPVLLVPEHRRYLLRVAACAFGAGLWANVGKLLVARTRPHAFTAGEVIGDTYQGYLPFLTRDGSSELAGHAIQSFPSGHTATAVGLAISLAWLYPRGRYLWASLALLAACQRIAAGAHWPSDTLAAACLAFFWAACCFHPRRLGRHFDRWESRGSQADEAVILPARRVA